MSLEGIIFSDYIWLMSSKFCPMVRHMNSVREGVNLIIVGLGGLKS